jgi:hypothetical protein
VLTATEWCTQDLWMSSARLWTSPQVLCDSVCSVSSFVLSNFFVQLCRCVLLIFINSLAVRELRDAEGLNESWLQASVVCITARIHFLYALKALAEAFTCTCVLQGPCTHLVSVTNSFRAWCRPAWLTRPLAPRSQHDCSNCI